MSTLAEDPRMTRPGAVIDPVAGGPANGAKAANRTAPAHDTDLAGRDVPDMGGQIVELPAEPEEAAEAQNTVSFDELALAEACINGDDRAFEELYTYYFPKVRNFCVRKLGNRELAEDIAQEAFARAFQRIGEFGGAKNFGGWVSTIAANLCTDHLRRKKNTPLSIEQVDQDPSYQVDPIRNIAREDTGRLVRLALGKLEPRHREALMLHEVRGMSCAAVGERLGISEVAAESLLARARRRLRKEITSKAAPADLFSFGGLALFPAILRAWRRFRLNVSRKIDDMQATAARGLEAVGLGALPTVDAARALVVAVGASLAIGVASAATPPPDKLTTAPTDLVSASAHKPIDPDGDGTNSGRAGSPVTAQPVNIDVKADGDGQVQGGASVKAPQGPGTVGAPGSDISFGVNVLKGAPGVATHVVLRGAGDQVLADTGPQQVGLP